MPADEPERLAALRESGLLDRTYDPELESLVGIARELCDAPVALLTVVDEHTSWVKAGRLAGRDVIDAGPRDDAFCAHTILERDLLVVDDARRDPRFSMNPYVLDSPNIRFYAGAPLLMPNGHALGALCIIDYVPHELSSRARGALVALKSYAETLISLRASNAALDRMQQRKERLIEYIAHDVKNALGVIQICAEELQTSVVTPDLAREVGADIGTASRRIGGLTLDLLDAIRAERSGAMSVRPAPVDVDELLSSTTRAIERVGRARGVELAVETGGLFVRGDRALLPRVLENLLDNALRHTPPGGTVKVSARVAGDDVVISVADTGPGVPPSHRDSVFELYESKSESSRGRGIGLAFCRLAVTGMGGRIWADDAPAGGAMFCVALPESTK